MAGARDPNLYEPDGPRVPRSIPGCAAVNWRLAAPAGSERLGATVWEVPPGESAYPFHFHHTTEELLVVLEGTPLLMDAEGWRRLDRGATVACLPGPQGAHRIHNDTDGPVRFLSVSTNGPSDVLEYPEVDRLGVYREDTSGSVEWKTFPLSAAVPVDPDDLAPPPPPPVD